MGDGLGCAFSRLGQIKVSLTDGLLWADCRCYDKASTKVSMYTEARLDNHLHDYDRRTRNARSRKERVEKLETYDS